MQSEMAASLAANYCNNGSLTVGKKQRHVEVFQCSGEDMSTFLSGMPALPSPGMEAHLLPGLETGDYCFPQHMIKPPMFSIPPPGYPEWSNAYANVAAVAKTTTTDSLPAGPKPSEIEMTQPSNMYQYAYPTPHPIYLMPRVPQMAYFPKPAFSPIMLPQLALTPMGLLNMKRSWEQAFPMETQMQAAKRWHGGAPSPNNYYQDL